jgi:hypothetical protein
MNKLEKAREATRRYRERNVEAVREKSRLQAAEYRRKNGHLAILEAVTNVDAFWSRVNIAGDDDCWNWTGAKTDRAYGIYAPLPGVLLRSHRVAYALHNKGIDESMVVCHKCDNPSCCNPNHLFLGTLKDNTADMVAKGRNHKMLGSQNPSAKLTSEQVRKIYLDPRTNKEIADEYGVSTRLPSMIRNRQVRLQDTEGLPVMERRKPGTGSSAFQLKQSITS